MNIIESPATIPSDCKTGCSAKAKTPNATDVVNADTIVERIDSTQDEFCL